MNELANSLVKDLTGPMDGSSAPWLAALRGKGSELFRAHGLPSKHLEQWKYTSLYKLEQQQPVLGVPTGSDSAVPEPLVDLPVRVSMTDGAMTEIHGEPDSGVHILSLQSALAEESSGLPGMLESLQIDQKGQGFSALNTANLGAGLAIHVARGVNAGELLLQWIESPGQGNTVFNSRVIVVLEEGAQLHLVEQYENLKESASILNVVMQHSLAENAQMTHTRVQQQLASSFLFTRTDVTQLANSRFHFTGLDLGDGLARHDVKAALLGSGANCALNGACITSGQSHADHHLEAAHVAGLSAASIMPLMRAQITVAKGIQLRVIDHHQTGGAPATPTPDLLTAVRPRLLTLAAEQLAALRCRIQGAGVFSGAGHRQLDSALADLKLTASERAALWNGLLEVRLRSVD